MPLWSGCECRRGALRRATRGERSRRDTEAERQPVWGSPVCKCMIVPPASNRPQAECAAAVQEHELGAPILLEKVHPSDGSPYGALVYLTHGEFVAMSCSLQSIRAS